MWRLAMLASASLMLAFTASRLCAQAPFDLDTGDPNRPKPPVEKPDPAPACTETLEQRQPVPGAVTFIVRSPCRQSGELAFKIDALSFQTAFDATGRAEITLPLFGATTHVTWADAGGGEQGADVAFQDFERTISVILVWNEPVDLDLRLVEPRGSFSANDAGNVYAGRPNFDLKTGYGILVRGDDGRNPGTHAEIYSLPAARNPVLGGSLQRAVIAQKIDFVTRDVVRGGDFCDGGKLAAPVFSIYRLVYGRVTAPAKKQFGALDCNAIDQSGNRLFRNDPPIDLRQRS